MCLATSASSFAPTDLLILGLFGFFLETFCIPRSPRKQFSTLLDFRADMTIGKNENISRNCQKRASKTSKSNQIANLLKNQSFTDKVIRERCFLLGLNTQSFRCHHEDLIVAIEKFDKKNHCSHRNLNDENLH